MGVPLPTFGNPGTFVWTDEMEREYHKVWKTLLEQICLTPYNPDLTRHRMKIDGASTKGIGFVFKQCIDELNPDKEAIILNAYSSRLKENQLDFTISGCSCWMDH